MALLRSIFGKHKKASNQFELLEVKEYKEAVINKKVQLVDVRTPEEYKKGHLGHALNIDYYDKKGFAASFDSLNKELPVYLYCRSGFRSKKAAMKLIAMGFKKVYDLKGGLNNWQ